MIDTLQTFGNLGEWAPPEECLPFPFLRYYFIVCGLITFILYLNFIKKVSIVSTFLDDIIGVGFTLQLMLVFGFCGLTHFIMDLSYLNQYFKIGGAILYPFLIVSMIRLNSKTRNKTEALSNLIRDRGRISTKIDKIDNS